MLPNTPNSVISAQHVYTSGIELGADEVADEDGQHKHAREQLQEGPGLLTHELLADAAVQLQVVEQDG